MTRYIHLTDIHLSDPAVEDPQLHSDTAARLAQALRLIAQIDPAPAFVAITGDLTNRGDRESYDRLKQALVGFDIPLMLALGNHDDRAAFRGIFESDAAEPDAPFFHHACHGDLHVIVLDSLMPGRVSGAIGTAQFEMLEEALGAHPGCGKLILCHHPPHSGASDLLRWACLDVDDSARLAEMLAGHDVAGMHCGHVHADRVLHWHGIPVIVSTGLHNTHRTLEPRDIVFEDGAGFALCDNLPAGLDVTFVPVVPRRRALVRIDLETMRALS